MKKLLTFSVIALLFSSCTFYSGTVSTNLAPSNIQYTRLASGASSKTQILIFGSLEKSNLVLEAKRNMYKNFPLEKDERFLNMTVDFKSTHFIIGKTVQCTVSSDIISSNGDRDELYSTEYLEMLNPPVENDSLFMVGDTITGRDDAKFLILSLKNKDEAYLKNLSNPQDTLFTQSLVSITGLISEYKGYELDEILRVRGKKFIVKGFKPDKAVLVSIKYGTLYHFSYKKLDQIAARLKD